MGHILPVQLVKLIVGMLSKEELLFEPAEAQMRMMWGEIDERSEIISFTATNYYEQEMGGPLLRKFVSFDELIEPGRLAAIKHQSNALEDKLGASRQGKSCGVARPINLDPGYIDPSKLVLVTTKNYSHRIYIGDSMYAEATLHYHKGSWQGWPFTYPDYAGGDYDNFLNHTRRRLMEQLSSRKENT